MTLYIRLADSKLLRLLLLRRILLIHIYIRGFALLKKIVVTTCIAGYVNIVEKQNNHFTYIDDIALILKCVCC